MRSNDGSGKTFFLCGTFFGYVSQFFVLFTWTRELGYFSVANFFQMFLTFVAATLVNCWTDQGVLTLTVAVVNTWGTSSSCVG